MIENKSRPASPLSRLAAWIGALSLLSSCATAPLSKTLATDHTPRLAIVGFKVSAPISRISSIADVSTQKLSDEEEKTLLDKTLREVEKKAGRFLVDELNERGAVDAIVVAEGEFGTRGGERPTTPQLHRIQRDLGTDAVLYGEIPWYGRTRLIYPLLGMTADIVGESLIIEFALHSEELVLANIGFELLTSTPLWFGGAEIFGWAFRPVTVEARVVSAGDGREVWRASVDRIVDREILKSYPERERSKKETQLEASLRSAVRALAERLSGKKQRSERTDTVSAPCR